MAPSWAAESSDLKPGISLKPRRKDLSILKWPSEGPQSWDKDKEEICWLIIKLKIQAWNRFKLVIIQPTYLMLTLKTSPFAMNSAFVPCVCPVWAEWIQRYLTSYCKPFEWYSSSLLYENSVWGKDSWTLCVAIREGICIYWSF